jgi:cysteinyl-tRNA synthetase
MKYAFLILLAFVLSACAKVPQEAITLRNDFAKNLATQNTDIATLNREAYQANLYYSCKEQFDALTKRTEARLSITVTDLERQLIMEEFRRESEQLEEELTEDANTYADYLRDDLTVSKGILALDEAANAQSEYTSSLVDSKSVEDLRTTLLQIVASAVANSAPDNQLPETPSAEVTE